MTLMQAASRRSMLAAASSCLPLAAVLLLGGCGKSEQAQTQRVAAAPTEVAAVQTPPPDYPIELACAGLGGKAVLSVVVGVQGKPTDVQLVSSSIRTRSSFPSAFRSSSAFLIVFSGTAPYMEYSVSG
jgi:protein TonB